MTFLASIPSPSSGTLDLGPLTIHMYGLMLLAGIAACIALTGVRWVRRGGDWDLIFRVAVWGVGAGIVGARLYHILTSWDELPDEWWGPFAVWEGGLGIWGGIGLGVIVGSIVAHRSGASALALLDAAAPGLLIAQAIGRVGNWWNQELFGKPTDLRVGARDRARSAGRTSTSSRRRSIPSSSTRRCGTSSRPGCCSCSTASTASSRRRSSPSTWCCTPASASSSSSCASIRRRNGWACASTRGSRSCSSSPPSPSSSGGSSSTVAPRAHARERKAEPPPTMAVPRGRVRPRR